MPGFVINANNCVGNVKNTGVPLCAIDPEFITGAIIAPRGTILDGTTLPITTVLSNLVYNGNRAARGYPMYDFEKITDSSDKLTIQSMPNGGRHPVREGWSDFLWQYFDGGLTKHQAARTFNGTNWDFFLIDTNPINGKSRLYGISVTDPTTGIVQTNKLQAFPVNPGGFIWAHPWAPNSGTERGQYNMQFVTKQTYTTDLLSAVTCPFDFPTALPGLNDVIVTASTIVNATTGSFNISLVSPMGTDIGALYSTQLSGTGKSNWVVKNATTKTVITITTSTWVPSPDGVIPGYFTLACTTTAPPYPVPPAPVLIDLVSASTLAPLGIDYESTGALSIAAS